MSEFQTQEELDAFCTFAKHHPAGLSFDLAVSRACPKPDIECPTHIGNSIAFELTEVLDPVLARNTSAICEIERSLDEAYRKLPADLQETLNQKYGNKALHFFPMKGVAQKTISRASTQILEYLSRQDIQDGAHKPTDKGILRYIRKIEMWPCRIPGPYMSVDGACGVKNPILELLRKKFEKIYQTVHPIELLLYFRLQLSLPKEIWMRPVTDFLSANIERTQFRRVWIYSFSGDNILLDYQRKS